MNLFNSFFARASAAFSSSPKIRGRFFALVTVVIWVGFIIIARASSHGSLTGLDIATLRILGASSVLLPIGFWITKSRRSTQSTTDLEQAGSFWGLSPLSRRLTVQMGLAGGSLYAALCYSGFFFAPAAHASVLLPGSLPLWTSLIAWLMIVRPINSNRMLGLVMILTGDLLVGGPSLLNIFNNEGVWRGDALFMTASISWSFYTVLVRQHGVKAVHATTAITVFSFFTFIPLYLILCLSGLISSNLIEAPIPEIVFQFLFQGVLSVVVSGITFNQMIRYFGPVRSTMITAVVPGLSAIGASLILGESMSLYVMCGLALVTLGIVFGVQRVPVKS
jgi:drug/metabolite transporter (DMT)-like permease